VLGFCSVDVSHVLGGWLTGEIEQEDALGRYLQFEKFKFRLKSWWVPKELEIRDAEADLISRTKNADRVERTFPRKIWWWL
jgi:hypothetical protein